MHELGIAENILDVVRHSVPAERLAAVRVIRLRVGPFAGVVTDSLEFCFSAIVADTVLGQASLQITPIALAALCRDCQRRFEVKDFAFRCPVCGSVNLEVVSGKELEVVDIELADETDQA